MNKTLSDEQLDELIKEATVDCYNDYESMTGFSVMIHDNISFPFPAKIVGEEVMVTDVTDDANIVIAICKKWQRI